MSDCIFCKITKKEIPAEIVYENETILGFLDINPVNPGHVLLIPKEHYASILETPDEIGATIFKESKKVMGVIKNAMEADYVTLSVIGVDVPHFHVHLIPRYFNDGLSGYPHKKYKEGEMEKTGEKIRSSF